jgi:tRNA pseudouridine55 synthase
VPGDPKVYEADISLGSETTTDDLTGDVLRQATPPRPDAVERAMATLTGWIDQIPPSFSAKQKAGVRAHAAARRGAPLDLAPVRVRVDAWEILSPGNPLRVRVTCGGGTYVRALARDLGRLAGSAAHLTALRRISSGPFALDRAVGPRSITAHSLLPAHAAVTLPRQLMSDTELEAVRHGRTVAVRTDAPVVALLAPGGDLAAVAVRAGEVFQPKVVLADV